MSEEIKSVADLKHEHVGKRLRVQSLEGGVVEGTVAGIRHRAAKPYGRLTRTWVSFEEFSYDISGSDEREYIWFETYANRAAKEVEE